MSLTLNFLLLLPRCRKSGFESESVPLLLSRASIPEYTERNNYIYNYIVWGARHVFILENMGIATLRFRNPTRPF